VTHPVTLIYKSNKHPSNTTCICYRDPTAGSEKHAVVAMSVLGTAHKIKHCTYRISLDIANKNI
jgi:hypothetical protein